MRGVQHILRFVDKEWHSFYSIKKVLPSSILLLYKLLVIQRNKISSKNVYVLGFAYMLDELNFTHPKLGTKLKKLSICSPNCVQI